MSDLQTIYATAGDDGADAEVPDSWRQGRIDGRYVILFCPVDDDYQDDPLPAWLEFGLVVCGVASLVWVVWYAWTMWNW